MQAELMKAAGTEWVAAPEGEVRLQAAMAPSLFAVAAGKDAAFLEKDGLATLRFTWSGIREVVLSPASAWSPAPGKTTAICGRMLQATASEVTAQRDRTHFATLGPDDVLYVPAGWITCKSVAPGRANDACGMRCSILHKGAAAVASLTYILDMATADGKADGRPAKTALATIS